MSEPGKPAAGRRRKSRLARLAVLLAVLAVAVALAHGPVLSWGFRRALEFAASAGGLSFQASSVRAGLFRPWVVEHLVLEPAEGATASTTARAARVEVVWSPLVEAFGRRGRLVERVALEGADVLLDFETVRAPEPIQRAGPLDRGRREDAGLLWLLPRSIQLGGVSLWILWPGGSGGASDLRGTFTEDALGELRASGAELWFGNHRVAVASQRAVTAWKGGEIVLAEADVQRGVTIENLAVSLANPGVVGVDLKARVFGGMVRGGGSIQSRIDSPSSLALWASGVDLAETFEMLGVRRKASGTLGEMKATFRGSPGRPLDGEAAVQLDASDVRWGQRGWERLELNASLINRRLSVGRLELRQRDNALSARGEVAVSSAWEDIAASPFTLVLSASLRDLGSLGVLLGPPFGEMRGRMTVAAELAGRERKVDGFLSVEGSGLAFRERTFDAVKLDALFQGGEMRVERLEVFADGDQASGKGAVGLGEPHEYWGQLSLRAADISPYAAMLGQPVGKGRVDLRWQGDGNLKAHSGAFELAVNDLVTPATPAGIDGRFSGTYSPGNVYLGGFEVLHGPLALTLRATLASSGIKVDDLLLSSKRQPLASGDVFLPLDVVKLAAGEGIAGAAIPGKELYAGLETTGDLDLAGLFGLAGVEAPGSGRLRGNLTAGGTIEQPTLDGGMRISDLLPKGGGVPAGVLTLDAHASAGRAWVQGDLRTGSLPPLAIQGELPFGLSFDANNQPRLIDPDGPVRGTVELPGTRLDTFRAMAPGLAKLGGVLRGSLEAAGTAGAPVLSGSLELQDGIFQASARAPEVDSVQALVELEGRRLLIRRCEGRVAAGPFRMTGEMDLAEPATATLDFAGEQILLHRSKDARVRADIRLRAADRRVAGEVLFVDGRFFKRVEITPFLAPTPADRQEPFRAPDLSGKAPPWLASWALDVRFRNKTPFQIVGDIAAGEIEPDLVLTGTLGEPLLEGSVVVRNARAFLPFTTMQVATGRADFYRSDPWMPYLDVRATAEVMDYEIFLNAHGPLAAQQLALRSDPPLPQEALILLLTTGFAPGFYSGAAFGEAAAGQGGLLVLRQLFRQFRLRGVDTEALLDRLQVTTSPPALPGERATLRGRVRLWRGLSAVAEQDADGFYNVGASYRWRFR